MVSPRDLMDTPYFFFADHSGVAEEVIDGEKLREGSSLGVVFSSREDGVT